MVAYKNWNAEPFLKMKGILFLAQGTSINGESGLEKQYQNKSKLPLTHELKYFKNHFVLNWEKSKI